MCLRPRKKSFKLIRSQSMQIPVSNEWAFNVVSPLLSPVSTCPSLPDSFPEYQRVTISGDYCAGVRDESPTLMPSQNNHRSCPQRFTSPSRPTEATACTKQLWVRAWLFKYRSGNILGVWHAVQYLSQNSNWPFQRIK